MADKIWDQEDIARAHGFADARTFRAVNTMRLGHRRKTGLKGSVEARLYRGLWIVDCPLCGGAEAVSRAEPEFYCLSCGMEQNGGQAMRVKFPKERPSIERVCSARPAAENRNWKPGDTLDELKALNKVHGLPEEAEA